MMQEKDVPSDVLSDVLKERIDSVELKSVPEDCQMQMTLVDEASRRHKKSEPATAERLEVPRDHSASQEAEPRAIPHKSSHGMARHKLMLMATAFVSLTTLAVNGFDLRALISQDGKIDRNFKFTPADDFSRANIQQDGSGEELHDGLIPIVESGFGGHLIGFADAKGAIAIEPKYKAAKNFSDGFAAVQMPGEKGKWGFINNSGKLVVPAIYDSVNAFHNGFAHVRENSKDSQIIDKDGRVCSPENSKDISLVGGNCYLFKDAKSNFWGLAKGAKILLPAQYIEIVEIPNSGSLTSFDSDTSDFYNATWKALVRRKGVFFSAQGKDSTSLADTNGNIFFTGDVGKIVGVNKNHAQICSKDGKFGFVDLKGKSVIAPAYGEMTTYDDLIAVRNNSKVSFIDATGRAVKTASVDNILVDGRNNEWLHEGLGVFKRGQLYGYLDTQGNEVIPARFTQARLFQKGQARVFDGKRWMFIDHEGNVVKGKKYLQLSGFEQADEQATATIDGPLYDALEEWPKSLLRRPDSVKSNTYPGSALRFEGGDF